MMTDLERAKQILSADSTLTLVLLRGEETVTATARGIAPMMNLLASEGLSAGFSAADRVVGKAAALLFVRAGVAAVHAAVISRPAREVLEKYGIPCTYGAEVDHIINRAGTGPCPMESAVRGTDDPIEAEQILRKKFETQS